MEFISTGILYLVGLSLCRISYFQLLHLNYAALSIAAQIIAIRLLPE